jgi:NADPH:quinone reductase-like Zn-dependent oxidoreductase
MVNIYGGGYAEKAVVDERAIAAKPSGLDHVHATAIPLAGQQEQRSSVRKDDLEKWQRSDTH